MNRFVDFKPQISTEHSALIDEFVRKHQLAVDELTEKQLAEAIRQALMSGEFIRQVTTTGNAQQVIYMPWYETEKLRERYNELIYAVGNKYEDETRHETALRYIREREAKHEGTDCCSSTGKAT